MSEPKAAVKKTAKRRSAARAPKAEQAATPADEPVVRVQVLEDGVTCRGAKFGKKAKPLMRESDAKQLESLGKVKITGL